MKTCVYVVLACLMLCSSLVSAAQWESLSLGFHLIPSAERIDGRRPLDLSLSLGATFAFDSDHSIDLMAIVDSAPSTLGTSAQYNRRIAAAWKAGFGATVVWAFSSDARLQWPILGTYVHASARTFLYSESWGETGVSVPLLTVANLHDEWNLLPLSELPTLTIAADARIIEQGSIQARLTLQPVLTDTTLLQDPIGRISDKLLILPMGSVFFRRIQ